MIKYHILPGSKRGQYTSNKKMERSDDGVIVIDSCQSEVSDNATSCRLNQKYDGYIKKRTVNNEWFYCLAVAIRLWIWK